MEERESSIERPDDTAAAGDARRKAATNHLTKTSAKSVPRKAPPEPDDDEIRRRAFEIYERRGGSHGSDMDDWFAAEREISDERHRSRDEDLTEQV